MTEQLKPCPFCGGKAKLYGSDHGKLLRRWFVECDACSTSSKVSQETDGGAEAIKDWNTREALAQPAVGVEPVALSALEEDAANLLFALHDAWPYVHQWCTIKSRKENIQRLMQKHGDFADIVPPAAARVPLTADEMKEPKNGKMWRVEWWNESCRMMLPTNKKLDSFVSYKNGTVIFTIKDIGGKS